MSDKEKKKFKDTGFGKFLSKAGKIVPELAGVAIKAVSGDIKGVIEETKDIFVKPENRENPEVQQLLREFELHRMDWEREIFQLEIADKASARQREVEMAKAGKTDWLQMITGVAITASFLAIVWAILFWHIPEENAEAFAHLRGIIEGAFVTGMVGYYFGTSKSSSDKTKMLSGK